MIFKIKKIGLFHLFLLIIIVFSLSTSRNFVFAQTTTDSPTPTITPTPTDSLGQEKKAEELQKQIDDLQNKISETQKQEKTLSSQISIMDSQIKLTELRINNTKQQIAGITSDIQTTTKKISRLEDNLNSITKVLLKRIITTYQVGTIQPFQILLSSDSVSDFFSRLNYLKIAQAHDKKLIFETQQTKNDYANQKQIFEDRKKKIELLKKQLEGYSAQLDQEKKDKQTLLDITRNDEQRYQSLLREAQAQIQAFKKFSLFQTGGAVSILPPQPSPDGWYYNQRDERWGRNMIGSSGEQVWDVGCLLTSIAMMMKKHGLNVTPSDTAANSNYYFSNTAYMLLPWAGGKFSSTWGLNQSEIDNKLLTGEPVIVGLKAGTYGMHFVVLKSGSNGNYIMNDPWYGPNLNFSEHYSVSQIFQYGFYNG